MTTTWKSGIFALAGLAVIAWAAQDKTPRSTRWPVVQDDGGTCSTRWFFSCARHRPLGYPSSVVFTVLQDDFA